MSDGQRKGLLGGAAIASVLTVFAVGSLATAELEQNSVQQSIDEGRESTCDVLVENCADDDAPNEADSGAADARDFVPGEGVDGEPAPVAPADGDPEAIDDPEAEGATVPGSTEPPVEEVLPPIERLALGDSVMLGAAGNLKELGFTVDAVESRSWANGLEVVQQLGEAERLPELMIIHLGTNSGIKADEMDAMMDAVADVDRVLLVTVVIPEFPGVAEANNSLIYATAGAYDNVSYMDWGGGLYAGCEAWAGAQGLEGDCFAADGIHLGTPGRRYYAQLMVDILEL